MRSINQIGQNKHHIAGCKIGNIDNELKNIDRKKNKAKAEKNSDYKNRQYVRNKILEYINEGLRIDEIVEEILSDDVMKNFEYLEKNGVDMIKCVSSWVQDAMKKSNEIDQQCK